MPYLLLAVWAAPLFLQRMTQRLPLRLRIPSGLALLMTGLMFLSFRLPWAAPHSAACFQAVQPFLQRTPQGLKLRPVLLSGLLPPLRLLLRLLRLPSWLPPGSWFAMPCRLMMPLDLVLLMPGSMFLSFRLPWAAPHSAACFQAVPTFLQRMTRGLMLRSVMLSGLLPPLRLLRRLLRLSSWLPLRSWMQPGS